MKRKSREKTIAYCPDVVGAPQCCGSYGEFMKVDLDELERMITTFPHLLRELRAARKVVEATRWGNAGVHRDCSCQMCRALLNYDAAIGGDGK